MEFFSCGRESTAVKTSIISFSTLSILNKYLKLPSNKINIALKSGLEYFNPPHLHVESYN